MRSYISLFGPNLLAALKKLDSLMTHDDRGELISTLLQQESPIAGPLPSAIKASTALIGKHDFVFEWFKKPTLDDIRSLINAIDEVVKPTGCRYTISTKR
jgi:hypothetical protein